MLEQDYYQKAILFAATKHQEQNQKIPASDLPYVVHLSNVAMEVIFASFHSKNFDTIFAVQLALLHDTIEDTSASFEELENSFGVELANGVLALSKDKTIDKEFRLIDSLNRIRTQPMEVWAVKLADRITNLQAPPKHWSPEKVEAYHREASIILEKLKGCNDYLEARLESKISEYRNYF
jgi:(p)ppGpp synthase/HD superfamily hydrolase